MKDSINPPARDRMLSHERKMKAPLRKIVTTLRVAQGMFDSSLVRLECGHEVSTYAIYRTRCRECLKEQSQEGAS